MEYNEAKTIADELLSEISMYFHRIEIAGSIRRQRSEVKDVELVGIRDLKSLITLKFTLDKHPKIKGRVDGKYMQFRYKDVINVDLFFAEKDNWGNIFAIRTGSAEYSHKVLARGWVEAGYRSAEGYLRNSQGGKIPLYEEKDLFDLIGIDWIPPEKRETELL